MSIPVLDNLDLNGNQILNVALQQLASDPGTPFEGQIWQNTTSDEVKAYLNGTVVILQSGPITLGDLAAAIKPSGTAAPGDEAVRALGTSASTALAGNTRLDQIAAPTSDVGLNNRKITGLADGSAATDAATKGQVDAAQAGLDAKQSVRAATTANITLSGAQTIDGVSVVATDRVLVKNQTTTADNGIYVAAAGAWARATDMDAWTEVPGAFVFVEEGTANADTGWVTTANTGGTLGSTALPWTKFSAAPTTALVKYAADITGNGVLTQFTVTHNLATTDVHVQVFDVAADVAILVEIKRPTANTVLINFTQAVPNAYVYRVVVVG